jgi:L-malate glycosyltransferase
VGIELARELAARGHEVDVFARRRPFGLPAEAGTLRVHALEQGGATRPDRLDDAWDDDALEALTSSVVGHAAAHGLDVLHLHYAVPFARVATAVRHRLGARAPRLVATLHGTDVSVHAARRRRGRPLRRDVAALDAVTTVSRAHAALSHRLLQLPEEPVVIPNFVDLDRFRPLDPAQRLGRRRRLVHVSNFRPVKDPRAVARIFAGVRAHLDAELWLVGDGAELPATLDLVDRAGLLDDVRLLGLRTDVEHILPETDLALVTSRHESFSLVALEAAASGVPVLATAVGGLPELIVDGVTGALHDPGDTATAVAAACAMLADPDRHAVMARSAAAHAARFDAAAVVPVYEQLYVDVLGGRRPLGAPRPPGRSLLDALEVTR